MGPQSREEPGTRPQCIRHVGHIHGLLGFARAAKGTDRTAFAALDVALQGPVLEIQGGCSPGDHTAGASQERVGHWLHGEPFFHRSEVAGHLVAVHGQPQILPHFQDPLRRAKAGAGVDGGGPSHGHAQGNGQGGSTQGQGGAAFPVGGAQGSHGIPAKFLCAVDAPLLHEDHVDALFCKLRSHHRPSGTRSHHSDLAAHLRVPFQDRDHVFHGQLHGLPGLHAFQAIRGMPDGGLHRAAPDVHRLHQGQQQACSLSDQEDAGLGPPVHPADLGWPIQGGERAGMKEQTSPFKEPQDQPHRDAPLWGHAGQGQAQLVNQVVAVYGQVQHLPRRDGCLDNCLEQPGVAPGDGRGFQGF